MANITTYETDAFDMLFDFEFGDFATKALDEAAPILEARMKANARNGIKHDGDSEMVNSIKASKAKRASNGAYIVNVGPRGYSNTKVYTAKNGKGQRTSRKYPVSNALKAIWKEYGIPSRGIPAQPFMSSATSQCENQIQDILQRKFEEKIKS